MCGDGELGTGASSLSWGEVAALRAVVSAAHVTHK